MEFKEKTDAERGFAAVWDRYIAPHLADYGVRYRRYRLLAILVMTPTICLFFAGAYYRLEIAPPDEQDLMFQLSFLAMLGVTSAICYFGYRPFARVKQEAGAQLFHALSEHFKAEFTPYDDTAELEEVADFLQDEKLTSSGSIAIGAAFLCARPGRHYRFFNCTYTSGTDRNRKVVSYLVLHLKLAVNVPVKIRILPDRGMANGLVRVLHRRKNVPLSNHAFEKRFEVYSHDEATAIELLTEPVQQAFVDMRDYFSKGRRWWQESCKVTAMFERDEMVICFSGLDDIAGHDLAGRAPEKILDAAHVAINRLSQIPFIVQNLRDVMPEIKR